MSGVASKRRARRQPHWICATTGICLCTGAAEDCACQRQTLGVVPVVGPEKLVRVDMCAVCKASMVCIDFATGELLEPEPELFSEPRGS